MRQVLVTAVLFVAAFSAHAQQDDRYRIGAGDVLDIRIYNRPQLSREAVRVEGSGMIRMPLIETEIPAACQTEGELAKEIATRYTKYYRNLQVDVFIKEYHSRQVAIIGAVNDQSRFELQRRVRLLELLTYAKGPSPKAGQTVNIVHSTAGTPCKQPDETADVASRMDAVVVEHVEALDPKGLMTALEHEPRHACGGGPMVAVMHAARQLGASEAQVLRYADSGDVSGDKSSVVGYLAAAVF